MRFGSTRKNLDSSRSLRPLRLNATFSHFRTPVLQMDSSRVRSKRGQQLLRMFRSVDFAVHLRNPPFGIDDVGDARRVFRILGFTGAVHHADFSIRIAQQRIWIVKLRRKGGVLFNGVKADPEDLNILTIVVFDSVAEPATFCGSTRRIRFRIKPEDDGFATIIGKADILSMMVLHSKIRSCISDV